VVLGSGLARSATSSERVSYEISDPLPTSGTATISGWDVSTTSESLLQGGSTLRRLEAGEVVFGGEAAGMSMQGGHIHMAAALRRDSRPAIVCSSRPPESDVEESARRPSGGMHRGSSRWERPTMGASPSFVAGPRARPRSGEEGVYRASWVELRDAAKFGCCARSEPTRSA